MGILDTIFGSSPKTTPVSQSAMTAEQQALLKELIAGLQGPFTPQGYAPLTSAPSPLESLSLAGLEAQAAGVQSGAGGEATKAASGHVQKLLSQGTGLPDDFDQFFETAIAAPLRKEFTERVFPQATRRFAGQSFGSDRERVERNLIQDLMDELAGQRSELAFATTESAKDRALQAAGIAPEIDLAGGELGVMRSNILSQALNAGAVPRGISERNFLAGREEFIRLQQEKKDRINQILSALGLSAVDTGITVHPGSSGLIGPALEASVPIILSKFL